MSPLRLSCLAALLAAASLPVSASDRLTSRPRPAAPQDRVLAVGDSISTLAGQARRVRLPDRSLLYIRAGSRVSLKAAGQLEVSRGEVFVETVGGKLAPTLSVQTPRRRLQASDSRFLVRADTAGTSVAVASGSVKVSGVENPVRGGQWLSEKAEKPERAPRFSQLVYWTRQLRQAATLVPASEHAGGTLVARDPDGQEANLELRRYHVDVHVEDGFARTTIDLTYFNHTQDRLEGTFRFPLPPDASLSRLAMYVDGKLMEGGMAERDHARAAYETILWEKRDPALLEWVDCSTFKMRVFPLEPRQEKRLLLSYTQRLNVLSGQLGYRFPTGHSLRQVRQWSFHARVKGGAGLAWQCDSHALKAGREGADLLVDGNAKDARLDRDVSLNLSEKTTERVRFSSMRQDGFDYLLVRYRPELPGASTVARRDWVVLAETSGDRDPLLARTQIELIRSLLTHAGRDDTFVVLTGGTRTRALRPRAVRNDLSAIDEAMRELEKVHLVGAFDLGAALNAARPFLEAAKDPYLVHVGSGIPAMGERTPPELLERLPKGTRYVGVGVGRRWEGPLMQTLAERTGGYFTQVNPDEELCWRGLELAETLAAPRLLDVSVSDPEGKVKFLPFSRLVSQGEELAAVGRFQGQAPAKVRVRGLLEGREFVRDIEVKDVRARAAYLPRSWAKLQIERLLAEDASKHKADIVELSKQMYVMTPFTSLLVLENDDMYTRFKVDRERKDHWAPYPAPGRIKVVVEPLEGDAGDPKKGIKPSARVARSTVVVRGAAPALQETPAARTSLPAATASASGANQRLTELLNNSEDLRQVGYEWRRIWFTDQPSHPTPERVHGGIQGGKPEHNFFMGFTNAGLRDPDPLVGLRLTVVNGEITTLAGRAFRPMPTLGMEGFTAGTSGEWVKAKARKSGRPRDWWPEYNPITGQTLNPPDGREGEGIVVSHAEGPVLYTRPHYTADDRLFHDLLSYAPGLNTSLADLRAVLDAEARPNPHSRPGTVAKEARAMIERACKPDWRTLTLSGWCVHFDGAGRYVWQRTLSSGLREQVVCDGKTLWHLYPELGLAARRAVSRHHRLDFAGLVPSALPTADDLARGADLVALDERTVAVVPHGVKAAKKHVRLHLLFRRNGDLAERRLVEMPAKKVLHREVYSAEGTWKALDEAGKEVFVIKANLDKAEAPSLKADVSNLVVLDLPFRTPEHVMTALGIEKKSHAELPFTQATRLLTAFVAAGNTAQARDVFVNALARQDQRQLGYYVLLASAGVNLDSDNLDVLDAHPHEPLAHYLALHSSPVLRKHASRWAAASNVWGEGLLRRLGVGHALCQRWSSGKSLGTSVSQRRGERRRALAYVKQYAGSDLAWALLGLMQDRTAEEKDDGERKAANRELAAACELFADSSSLGGLARYEQARCLWRAGQADEARKQFTALYRAARKEGRLLRLDSDFRDALLGAKEGWAELLRETATDLVAKKARAAVLLLARQCWQLDDQVTSRRLLEQALRDVPVAGKQGLALYGAAVAWLAETQQNDEADRLLRLLLADAEHSRRPELWRRAAELAARREQPARALEALEKALALEYAHQPEVINLASVRQDYRGLLTSYAELVRALATLKLPVPAGFRDRVVRAADRWRSLDREQGEACKLAASTLRGLGEGELAFDYLTTPVALRPGEADVWVGLAGELVGWGERDLADRAYRSAFERESSNAQILWDRAENLRRAGRLARARQLYRQLAEGEWQARFASLQTQARWMLEGN